MNRNRKEKKKTENYIFLFWANKEKNEETLIFSLCFG
jgi:hypothetical protein